MIDVSAAFDERLQEIQTYFTFLESLEREAQTHAPSIGNIHITAQQQKILYSAVYLQLYNLVEATVTWCLDSVSEAASLGGRWYPNDLSPKLRREWVRHTARTHTEMNSDNRLDHALSMCDVLIHSLPLPNWQIARTGTGNWDDERIETIAQRLGCDLLVSTEVFKQIKRRVRDDKGALALVRDLRNRLAHGGISFSECGDGVTVADLTDIRDRTVNYLREVIAAYVKYVETYGFLVPERRPLTGQHS